MSHLPEYQVWSAMKRRCLGTMKNCRKNYADRGITYHATWNDFAVWFAYVGARPSPQHTLERINNNGNYEPGNVRWATRFEQAHNKRTNRQLTYQGRTQTMAEWCREQTLVTPKSFESRLLRGWTLEQALTTPAGKSKLHRYATFNGETLHLSEWARRMKLPRNTITARLSDGWSVEEAISTPLRPRRWFRRPVTTVDSPA